MDNSNDYVIHFLIDKYFPFKIVMTKFMIILSRVTVILKPIPETLGVSQEYTSDGAGVQDIIQTHNYTFIQNLGAILK